MAQTCGGIQNPATLTEAEKYSTTNRIWVLIRPKQPRPITALPAQQWWVGSDTGDVRVCTRTALRSGIIHCATRCRSTRTKGVFVQHPCVSAGAPVVAGGWYDPAAQTRYHYPPNLILHPRVQRLALRSHRFLAAGVADLAQVDLGAFGNAVCPKTERGIEAIWLKAPW